SGGAARARASGPGRIEPEEGVAHRKSAGRLEPERPAQDHGLRLFAAREGAADGLGARLVGRGGGLRARTRFAVADLRQRSGAPTGGARRRTVRAGARAQAEAAPAGAVKGEARPPSQALLR